MFSAYFTHLVRQTDAQQLLGLGTRAQTPASHKAAPHWRIQQLQRHRHRLGLGTAHPALIGQIGNFGGTQLAIARIHARPRTVADHGMHQLTLFHAQQHHMPRLPVVQGARHTYPVQAGNRRRKALHHLTAKVVKGLGVFFHTKQAAFRFCTRIEILGITDADHQQTTIAVGKGAEGFHHTAMLGADTLEIQRAAFMGGQ